MTANLPKRGRPRMDTCGRGHAWTPANTYESQVKGKPYTRRHCRKCHAITQAARRAAKR